MRILNDLEDLSTLSAAQERLVIILAYMCLAQSLYIYARMFFEFVVYI